ncbi:heme lyase CcmF/NrfE family subunit [Shewanella schlegeliana]|uniref:Heme lyase CcmF/NrfE family subunit n=1 Tax=Shewanella schlegeliana TaxID=190308 RepID=A0ABS1T244_9GAMM|nr:heme lyase CcmF/NrfE family subunit [Shewanella schlegeliana]MBL4914861.1 heme lyase CcmF/NrfE family subunit [Shewanella schlegeliana]MCL1110448.1 heme lyase CcmF/NrfE family subunit [Shewanella schlegeliana]GIU27623.1 heme lyase CcmF/NrfE family subunit [Shewanella schlegeliana]
MIPELGLIFLIISTVSALILSFIPLYASYSKNSYLFSYVKPLTALMTVSISTSILCLLISFLVDDFSVAYVANHSNTQLATLYKVAAVWGSHEGSMLFWVVSIAIWGCLIVFSSRYQDPLFVGRMIAILAFVIAGFNLFMLFTSNPFARLLPNFPIEGRDLNPILQDIGLIFHPPMLFLGYVGLTITFAAAIAALLGGKFTQQHASYLRPWVLMAWVFLTGGNAFGSWWAYNELGWGGWWFWDPVENASFIPWLVATALLHSVVLSQHRSSFKVTTLLLCLLAFSLSLLGTFLVRSGIVQSVHAFASDPTRGMSILSLLGVFVCGALTLFALKGNLIKSKSDFSLISRDSFILLGNIVLVVAAISVLLGTFYPLLFELLNLGTLSVGAPYFNSMFVPLTFVAVLLMGAAPLIKWQKQSLKPLKPLLYLLATAVAIGIIVALQTRDGFNPWVFIGATAAAWVILTLGYLVFSLRQQGTAIIAKKVAMMIAHLGVAVTIIGATAVSNFESQELLRMGPGQGKEVAGYTFVYEDTVDVETNSYTAIQANIRVMDSDENDIGYITPQRQTFKTNAMETTQAGIMRNLVRDLYVSSGQQLSETEYLVRISHKPLACWIWIGGLMMMFGGSIAAFSGLYSLRRTQAASQTVQHRVNTDKALQAKELA